MEPEHNRTRLLQILRRTATGNMDNLNQKQEEAEGRPSSWDPATISQKSLFRKKERGGCSGSHLRSQAGGLLGQEFEASLTNMEKPHLYYKYKNQWGVVAGACNPSYSGG